MIKDEGRTGADPRGVISPPPHTHTQELELVLLSKGLIEEGQCP